MSQTRSLTPELIAQLIARAKQASTAAYAPYSQFKVGAAVCTSDGGIYSGCNIENASYGLTVCAERVAIWKAISEGHQDIIGLAVYTPTDSHTPPCGACRQVAYEFGPTMVVVCASEGGKQLFALQELLPGAFGPSDLNR